MLATGSTLRSIRAPSDACRGQEVSAVQIFLPLGAWAMAHPSTSSVVPSCIPSILDECPWPGQSLQSSSVLSG